MTLLISAILIAQATLSSFDGVVRNSATNQPVSRASIALLKLGGAPADARLATTSAEGKFGIHDIAPGR